VERERKEHDTTVTCITHTYTCTQGVFQLFLRDILDIPMLKPASRTARVAPISLRDAKCDRIHTHHYTHHVSIYMCAR
jgi:hypothetical protein